MWVGGGGGGSREGRVCEKLVWGRVFSIELKVAAVNLRGVKVQEARVEGVCDRGQGAGFNHHLLIHVFSI